MDGGRRLSGTPCAGAALRWTDDGSEFDAEVLLLDVCVRIVFSCEVAEVRFDWFGCEV
jgi:hypothetical protein